MSQPTDTHMHTHLVQSAAFGVKIQTILTKGYRKITGVCSRQKIIYLFNMTRHYQRKMKIDPYIIKRRYNPYQNINLIRMSRRVPTVYTRTARALNQKWLS